MIFESHWVLLITNSLTNSKPIFPLFSFLSLKVLIIFIIDIPIFNVLYVSLTLKFLKLFEEYSFIIHLFLKFDSQIFFIFEH